MQAAPTLSTHDSSNKQDESIVDDGSYAAWHFLIIGCFISIGSLVHIVWTQNLQQYVVDDWRHYRHHCCIVHCFDLRPTTICAHGHTWGCSITRMISMKIAGRTCCAVWQKRKPAELPGCLAGHQAASFSGI